MGAAERIALAIVSVATITTLTLPGRQTVPAINAFTNLFRGSLATAMGIGKKI